MKKKLGFLLLFVCTGLLISSCSEEIIPTEMETDEVITKAQNSDVNELQDLDYELVVMGEPTTEIIREIPFETEEDLLMILREWGLDSQYSPTNENNIFMTNDNRESELLDMQGLQWCWSMRQTQMKGFTMAKKISTSVVGLLPPEYGTAMGKYVVEVYELSLTISVYDADTEFFQEYSPNCGYQYNPIINAAFVKRDRGYTAKRATNGKNVFLTTYVCKVTSNNDLWIPISKEDCTWDYWGMVKHYCVTEIIKP